MFLLFPVVSEIVDLDVVDIEEVLYNTLITPAYGGSTYLLHFDN